MLAAEGAENDHHPKDLCALGVLCAFALSLSAPLPPWRRGVDRLCSLCAFVIGPQLSLTGAGEGRCCLSLSYAFPANHAAPPRPPSGGRGGRGVRPISPRSGLHKDSPALQGRALPEREQSPQKDVKRTPHVVCFVSFCGYPIQPPLAEGGRW